MSALTTIRQWFIGSSVFKTNWCENEKKLIYIDLSTISPLYLSEYNMFFCSIISDTKACLYIFLPH